MKRPHVVAVTALIAAAVATMALPRLEGPGRRGRVQARVDRPPAPAGRAPVETEGGGPSGALQALQSWGAQRAYPQRTIPDAAYGAALERARGMTGRAALAALDARLAAPGDAQGAPDDRAAPWTAIGPANVGGRTLCLAIRPDAPDVLFAGSASGGLWKTTTGGVGADAWDYVDTGYPVLGVSTIAIDPAEPDVMYIGTGEAYDHDDAIGGDVVRTTRGSYGIGVLKSTDGGATWTTSLDWTYAQSRGVWMIQIHPVDHHTLFVATTEGVYRSRDAGGSWTLVHPIAMAMDVRIDPAAPDIVYAAHGNFGSAGTGIYRSADGGDTWTRLANGLPATWTGKAGLAVAAASPGAARGTVYASIADEATGRGLYRTTDGGDTWTLVNATDYPQYQGWYSHYVVVSPFDPQVLFAGGIEIWRSTDGGATLGLRTRWTSVYFGASPPQGPIGGPDYAHADQHFAVWHPADPDTIYFASDGGIFRSTNLGATFESLIGGYQTGQFYNGFANSGADPHLAIGGLQDNFPVIYEGTNAWRRVIGGDGTWTSINPIDPAKMFASIQNLDIYRSRDGGNRWSLVAPPEAADDVTAFAAPHVLAPGQPSVLYAGRSRVYRSGNEGSAWSATNGGRPLDPGNPVQSIAVSRTNAAVVYAGTAPLAGRARVFRTRDSGAAWTDITGILPDRYPSDLAVDPNDDLKVYVTLMGFGTSHIFRSADGGDTWIDIGAGLPDIPASAIEVDPLHPGVIYAGTDLGVFVSANDGASWLPFTRGMPQAMVNDLKVYAQGGVIRAATHGNGAWERALYQPCAAGDVDADGICDMEDCAPLDPQAWRLPGEVRELRVAPASIGGGGGEAILAWSPPMDTGGTVVVYDTVSSSNPADFLGDPSVACVEAGDGTDTTAMDARLPAAGAGTFYIVRARNACGAGPAGGGTAGVPRQVADCPGGAAAAGPRRGAASPGPDLPRDHPVPNRGRPGR